MRLLALLCDPKTYRALDENVRLEATVKDGSLSGSSGIIVNATCSNDPRNRVGGSGVRISGMLVDQYVG